MDDDNADAIADVMDQLRARMTTALGHSSDAVEDLSAYHALAMLALSCVSDNDAFDIVESAVYENAVMRTEADA